MLASTNARIERHQPKRQFTESTYRAAKPFLLHDFGGRCAYSLQHVDRVGYKSMEVDHFNPTLSGLARNKYPNLFPATRHCNGSKGCLWPDLYLRKAGVRFLNPTKEHDYGVHIFEDPATHHLLGATPAGKYHIRCCDLNAPHLVLERRDRAKLNELLNECGVISKVSLQILENEKVLDTSAFLRAVLSKMILPIPSPPKT